ncbi:hypothetical protein B5E91_00495 [Thomasclavelia spiroformis]|uniref:YihY/virulence factor BrkB family protein n=1 Tax=Thomasclavelia spiroformis TaxID=29348 RepID=A0A1Y4QMD8_9FIRM|nr:YhjD/YihY/BrkB family envelope integrity protein [Thomasclavelia spiroformis]OUQ06439.1 hypothetical protein B5E91_00495 [Thomasclavelia spiroformis]
MHRFKRVVLKFFSSQGNLFRYSSSFCMLLGLLPGLIIVLRIFQNEILNNPKLVEFLYWYLPKELISPFIEYVLSKDYDTYLSLIISMGLSIYLASNAIYSFMLISKDDEGFDTYNILIRIKAIIMFISLIIGLILLAFINYFTRSIIVIEIGFFSLFYFFYRFLSFEKRSITYGIVGSLFTCTGIMIVGIGFIYFIDNYTRYDVLYGPLASIVVLLISIYLISSIIYFGYCLNHEYTKCVKKPEYKGAWYYNSGSWVVKKIIKLINSFKNGL